MLTVDEIDRGSVVSATGEVRPEGTLVHDADFRDKGEVGEVIFQGNFLCEDDKYPEE